MDLTVGSLFSGIGGLDLGLERAGMEVIWQSEIDPYACKVLSKHWPEVVNHGNIKEINWQEVERPDVICGGYPCQPFSTAGKRRGEEDPRHLWPWVREAISELRPRYAILENVRGHLSMGGLSVIAELASIGYDAEWRVVSAASVGANHRRDRIVIVAYPNNTGSHREEINSADTGFNALGGLGGCSTNVADTDSKWGYEQCQRQVQEPNIGGCCANMANTNGGRCQQCKPETKPLQGISCSCKRDMANTESSNGRGKKSHGLFTVYGETTKLREQGCLGRPISSWWEVEPDVGRVANGVPSRVDRLRGLGNAVVPQVAEVIGRLVISDYQRRED